MFEVIRASDRRLDLIMSGEFDADDTTRLLDALFMEGAGLQDGRMLLDIQEFHMPSLGAIRVELQRLPEIFRLLKHLSRVAVLSGEGWVNTLAVLEGKLLPGVAIKSYRRDQRYQAESWLESEDEHHDPAA